ncbi:hypothetical protein C9374_004675 [Naegleria lovaniensis]|uniref:HAMP domain-containing protein n=1 Tax=Naegleria lovaniensis TaxID=51637 RepID=A0AA88GSH1_NAELO|nr:uncharacterized protein C9374_004675 [Naegleria lovaniensis]KAG2383338.1 hypothetical protein C9374_004675 [Naegleria lovaniensis]
MSLSKSPVSGTFLHSNHPSSMITTTKDIDLMLQDQHTPPTISIPRSPPSSPSSKRPLNQSLNGSFFMSSSSNQQQHATIESSSSPRANHKYSLSAVVPPQSSPLFEPSEFSKMSLKEQALYRNAAKQHQQLIQNGYISSNNNPVPNGISEMSNPTSPTNSPNMSNHQGGGGGFTTPGSPTPLLLLHSNTTTTTAPNRVLSFPQKLERKLFHFQSSGEDDQDDVVVGPNYSRHPKNNGASSSKIFFISNFCFNLSLRIRTMMALFITSAIIVALCALGLSLSFEFSFSNVEKLSAIDAVRKTSKALRDDYKIILGKLYEYAAWDDVYESVKSQTTASADDLLNTYFSCDYMNKINLNYVMMYFKNGTFFRGTLCYSGYTLTAFPEELIHLDHSFFFKGVDIPETRISSFFVPNVTIQSLFEQSGLIVNSNTFDNHSNALMITAQPIQPTDNSETNGLLIFARYLTHTVVNEIAQRTQLCTTIFDLTNSKDVSELMSYFNVKSGTTSTTWSTTTTNSQLLNEYLSTKSYSNISISDSWTLDDPFQISAHPIQTSSQRLCYKDDVTATHLSSYKLFKDYKGQYSMIIRTDFQRDLYQLGWNSFAYTTITILALVVVMTVVVLVFVELVVLQRVLKIGNFVNIVTRDNDTSRRIPHLGKDELGKLSKDINRMLEALETSHATQLKDYELMQTLLERTALEEEQNRCIMNSIQDFVVNIECTTGKVINLNASFEKALNRKFKRESTHGGIYVNEFMTDFGELQQALEKLESLSLTQEPFQTEFTTTLGAKYPVSLTVKKTKMTLREGVIGFTYIMVMKNMKEQVELQTMLSRQQEQLEEIQKIQQFDQVMADEELRARFKEFTIQERSSENFLFLEDVEYYKSLSKSTERAKLQQDIILKYLLPDSPQPLNISQKILHAESKKIVSGYGQLGLFDRLETLVKAMILDDTFRRFMDQEQNKSPRTDSQ